MLQQAARGVSAARVDGVRVFVDVPDDALLVHHKRRAVGKTVLFVEYPVFLRNLPLEIAEEGISEA